MVGLASRFRSKQGLLHLIIVLMIEIDKPLANVEIECCECYYSF